MDNVKIGKLIAKMRKKKGLTQQELGDKFGIGYRAVSNWERGNCLPDISIINELSVILGISSDELLNGEINNDNKSKIKENDIRNEVKDNNNKSKKKNLRLIIVIIVILASLLLLKIYFSNKTYKYKLISTSDEYIIDGYVEIYKDNLSLVINKLEFTDEEFLNTEIINYDYQVMLGDELVFGYGYKNETKMLEMNFSILDFTDKFEVNYDGKNDKTSGNMHGINIKIFISFQITEDIIIKKEINIITE